MSPAAAGLPASPAQGDAAVTAVLVVVAAVVAGLLVSLLVRKLLHCTARHEDGVERFPGSSPGRSITPTPSLTSLDREEARLIREKD